MDRFVIGMDRRDLVVLILVPVLVITGLIGAMAWLITGVAGAAPVRAAVAGPLTDLRAVPTGTVLDGLADDTPVPTTEGLRQSLASALASAELGSRLSLEVVDARTGATLYGVDADLSRIPASTTKLLTAAAALTALGSQTTVPTTVVTGATDSEIVLVGGGDVLLSAGHSDTDAVVGRAGLADLAKRTATALAAKGRDTVSLRLDDTLFTGPVVNPAWSPEDVSDGFVAPIMALEVNEGRVGTSYSRQTDPALVAAKTFAARLTEQGITVTGAIARAAAPASADTLAEIRSAPLGEVVEFALTESDNTVAEALARLVAVHRQEPVTFSGAGRAVVDQIDDLGVPVTGVRLLGGSGLARGNAIPARSLTGLLTLAAGSGPPSLSWMLSGLPVAGASGTLENRFDGRSQFLSRGMVRAKTGSLTGVNALAGVVVDADGRLLVFAVLADHTGKSGAARQALDSVASVLAGCGCR